MTVSHRALFRKAVRSARPIKFLLPRRVTVIVLMGWHAARKEKLSQSAKWRVLGQALPLKLILDRSLGMIDVETSTGPLASTSFNPSCCSSAAKMLGRSGSIWRRQTTRSFPFSADRSRMVHTLCLKLNMST